MGRTLQCAPSPAPDAWPASSVNASLHRPAAHVVLRYTSIGDSPATFSRLAFARQQMQARFGVFLLPSPRSPPDEGTGRTRQTCTRRTCSNACTPTCHTAWTLSIGNGRQSGSCPRTNGGIPERGAASARDAGGERVPPDVWGAHLVHPRLLLGAAGHGQFDLGQAVPGGDASAANLAHARPSSLHPARKRHATHVLFNNTNPFETKRLKGVSGFTQQGHTRCQPQPRRLLSLARPPRACGAPRSIAANTTLSQARDAWWGDGGIPRNTTDLPALPLPPLSDREFDRGWSNSFF